MCATASQKQCRTLPVGRALLVPSSGTPKVICSYIRNGIYFDTSGKSIVVLARRPPVLRSRLFVLYRSGANSGLPVRMSPVLMRTVCQPIGGALNVADIVQRIHSVTVRKCRRIAPSPLGRETDHRIGQGLLVERHSAVNEPQIGPRAAIAPEDERSESAETPEPESQFHDARARSILFNMIG